MSAARGTGGRDSLSQIAHDVERCERCPRLVAYCRAVAREKRRAFADWTYWGKPVPGFGDPEARVWIVGLAPAAHGGNRTGRVFTGDRSGDFLYAALHRAQLANQALSVSQDDGLELRGAYVSAAGRCAPPANKPAPEELANCAEYLVRESRALRECRAIVALGGIAWEAVLRLAGSEGLALPKPKPAFAHGAELGLGERMLLGCYHVSQQNTFTGRLTPVMLDRVLARAQELAR